MKEIHIPLVVLPACMVFVCLLTVEVAGGLIDRLPQPKQIETAWEAREDVGDTTLPNLPVDLYEPAPQGWDCQQDGMAAGTSRVCSRIKVEHPAASEVVEAGRRIGWSYNAPRKHPRACESDDQCMGGRQCSADGHCVECVSSMICPGNQVCREDFCVDPE